MENNEAEEFLRNQPPFRTNAFRIINKMVEWCGRGTVGSRHLVDEILHSIFFLGKINRPPFSPEEIVGNLLNDLREEYPSPFDHYETHLPRRSPFSCVLDMVVLQNGPENEDEIRSFLQDLVNGLGSKFLVSATICVSQFNNSTKQYGVSMSIPNGKPATRKILIAASCLSSYWDEYVADAVMTYYTENLGMPEGITRTDFNGTINLDSNIVKCNTYLVKDVENHMPPCQSCRELFGLHPNETRRYHYGNCAETESLSKLFKNDQEIKQQSRPTSALYTEENRKRARADTLARLNNFLETVGFNTWENQYYPA